MSDFSSSSSLPPHLPFIRASQRVLFRGGQVGVQGGWQQAGERGLGRLGRGVGRGLVVLLVLGMVVMMQEVVLVVVERRAVVGDDGGRGGEDIGGGRGGGGHRGVAPRHAGVGGGAAHG